MGERGRAALVRKARVIGLLVAILVSAAVALRLLVDAGEGNQPQAGAAADTMALQQLAWFDESDRVYHGIPARIAFALPVDGNQDGKQLAEQAWQRIRTIGERFNAFDPSSEVGRLNAEPVTAPVHVSEELAGLLYLCRSLYNDTDGAFDPTIWPLKRLWQDAADRGRLPDPAAVAAAMEKAGFNRLFHGRGLACQHGPGHDHSSEIPMVREVPGMALDFGGIVKGHAVDRVAALIRESGAQAWLVQIGGEISAHGVSPTGSPWRIGVRHPLKDDALIGVLSRAEGLSVSTSGNYEQPLTIQGQDYYHIVDPRTGEPVSTSLLGVTVVYLDGQDRNAMADGIATSLAIMGPEKGLEFVEERPLLAALFLVRGPEGTIREIISSRMAPIYLATAGGTGP